MNERSGKISDHVTAKLVETKGCHQDLHEHYFRTTAGPCACGRFASLAALVDHAKADTSGGLRWSSVTESDGV
jgi:hypothetical protein